MAPESLLVVTVGAAFLLLGIAASPLGWVAILQRRSQSERKTDDRLSDLTEQIRALYARLELLESSRPVARNGDAGDESPDGDADEDGPRPVHPTSAFGRRAIPRAGFMTPARPVEPRLIAVPNLAASHDREATVNGLNQRYAAIWSLADSGASPEVIARATGQPIGQIELILGLRRQLDGGRTSIPHARHD